jgi:hypothetical protein
MATSACGRRKSFKHAQKKIRVLPLGKGKIKGETGGGKEGKEGKEGDGDLSGRFPPPLPGGRRNSGGEESTAVCGARRYYSLRILVA